MKKLLLMMLPLLVLLACGKTEIKSISPAEAKTMLEGNASGLQIIDLRTPEEIVNTGMLPGATAIDFTDPGFEQMIGLINKNQPVLLYCASGARSARAAALLQEKGYKKVYNLATGMNGWKAAGNQTVPVK